MIISIFVAIDKEFDANKYFMQQFRIPITNSPESDMLSGDHCYLITISSPCALSAVKGLSVPETLTSMMSPERLAVI